MNPRLALGTLGTTQSFHVFLAVFFDQVDLEQVEQEWWDFASDRRLVTIGCLSTRGHVDLRSPIGVQVFERFEDLKLAFCRRPLDERVHWCRFCFGQKQWRLGPTEFLFDNEKCELMEQRLAELEWPLHEEFYFVRRFFVIHPAV